MQLGIGHCGIAVPLARLCYILVVHLYGQPFTVLHILHCYEGLIIFFYEVLELWVSDYLFWTDKGELVVGKVGELYAPNAGCLHGCVTQVKESKHPRRILSGKPLA